MKALGLTLTRAYMTAIQRTSSLIDHGGENFIAQECLNGSHIFTLLSYFNQFINDSEFAWASIGLRKKAHTMHIRILTCYISKGQKQEFYQVGCIPASGVLTFIDPIRFLFST
jgi:hypothetical protein